MVNSSNEDDSKILEYQVMIDDENIHVHYDDTKFNQFIVLNNYGNKVKNIEQYLEV